ncbi:fructosamine-3-kinase isoform X5 [Ursus arctos]|uniref:fructosamine-3-kinase isoform X5 n=1 Tax=Ursus arctos TaxID=9644 RepID=UPI00254821E9|nr:fructosamine-3-kinase isoform X5 [Ursus arctos]XP_057174214.1 fructosamine-3-kinase isoform X5 [Ursus arctos]
MWSRPPALSGQCEPSWAGDLCPRDSGLYPELCPESCWGPGRGPARVRGASAGTFWQGAPWVGPTTKLSGHPVRTQVEGTAPPLSPYGNPPPALALRLRPSAAARAGGERGDLTLRASGRTARSPQAAQTRRLPRRSAASAAADSAPVGLCAVPGPPRPPCPPPPWSSCCAPSCAPRPCGPSGAPGPAASARGAPTTRTRAPCSSRSTAGRRWEEAGRRPRDHKGPARAPLLTGLCSCLHLGNACLKFAVKYTVWEILTLYKRRKVVLAGIPPFALEILGAGTQ